MCSNRYFFDVPVYRLPKERYYEERDAYVEKQLFPGPEDLDEQLRRFFDADPDRKLARIDRYAKMYGGPWWYNEIIGMIKLYFSGPRINSELWLVEAKRIVRTKKKLFALQFFETGPYKLIQPGESNKRIYALILEHITECQEYLKGRFIDISLLETLGPYVDWRRFLRDV